jgi:hypothetical protein
MQKSTMLICHFKSQLPKNFKENILTLIDTIKETLGIYKSGVREQLNIGFQLDNHMYCYDRL